MTKDEILELYNVEDYSSIKKLIENSNISEKQNILNILAEADLVASDLSYYDGLISKYGEDDPRGAMLELKRINLLKLRKEIERLF